MVAGNPMESGGAVGACVSADAHGEGGLPPVAEALVEEGVRRRVVERRSADRREVPEGRAEAPVRDAQIRGGKPQEVVVGPERLA